MIITIEQLKNIINAQGNLVLDGSTFILSQLKELATAAATQNVSITIKKISNLTSDQLVGLANIAPGKIYFDLTM